MHRTRIELDATHPKLHSHAAHGNEMEYLDRTYLIMLMKYGITTAIVNAYDKELMAICKGERQAHVGDWGQGDWGQVLINDFLSVTFQSSCQDHYD